MSQALLTVEGVSSGYGKGDIIHDVNLTVAAGEIVTVIGPNGAGKSTLVKTIAGVVRRRAGSIAVEGTEIGGLPASEVARRGVAYVPQEANVFRSLSVLENLEMGAWTLPAEQAERRALVFDLFPALVERQRVRAGNLSGGQRQMVAFGMAMMVEPRLLLLDEPSAGLSPKMVEQMFATVRRVNAAGLAVLMVEQNAIQALRISDRGVVMAGGAIQMSDAAGALLENKQVGELYLGTSE